MIAEMIPISFNTNRNVQSNSFQKNDVVIPLLDKEEIKPAIEVMLFEYRYNSVLIKFNNELFVCEPISATEKRYSRRKVEYHPLMDKFN
jgi:hypothetical protein